MRSRKPAYRLLTGDKLLRGEMTSRHGAKIIMTSGERAPSTTDMASVTSGSQVKNTDSDNVNKLLEDVAEGQQQQQNKEDGIHHASLSSSNSGSFARTAEQLSPEELHMCELILDIGKVAKRDVALHELSKRREQFPNLACYLWFSFGTVAAFLQEIIAVYPHLHPPTLTAPQSHRVCNCLALLQCIASHPEMKRLCLRAHIPLYLYPFLNSIGNNRALEFLRLTALGVVGALVKGDDLDVLRFLLQSEIVPLCLRIMDSGSELSQTVATFIVQKVLSYDEGLAYLCATAERFYAVSSVLSTMLCNTQEPPSARLLKHIVRCYLRLCANRRAREAFKHCLPSIFWTDAFAAQIKIDPAIKKWISHLLEAVSSNNNNTATNDKTPTNATSDNTINNSNNNNTTNMSPTTPSPGGHAGGGGDGSAPSQSPPQQQAPPQTLASSLPQSTSTVDNIQR